MRSNQESEVLKGEDELKRKEREEDKEEVENEEEVADMRKRMMRQDKKSKTVHRRSLIRMGIAR